MKILFITESFPFPLDTGGKIVSYQMLTMLSSKHEVHLVALSNSQPSEKEIKKITSLGVKTYIIVSKKRNPWYKQSKFELARAILHLIPPAIASFQKQDVTDMINTILVNNHIDVVHVEHLSMAQYFPKKKTGLWIFQEQNIEYKLYRDFFLASPMFSSEQLLNFCNFLMLSVYERLTLKRADQIIVLSNQDKSELVRQGVDGKKILIIPPSVKPINYSQRWIRRNNELLFIGNLWWKPNFDAISWFLWRVFPLLQKTDSSISLTIIGDGSSLLDEYASNNKSVFLLDKQKNITQYLKRASVFILPFRIGQGVRIKALTALSYNLPIVSTAVGVRGINIKPEKEYLKAEVPSEYVRQIIRLVHNPKIRKSLSFNSAILLRANHNPSAIQQKLLTRYATDSIRDR